MFDRRSQSCHIRVTKARAQRPLPARQTTFRSRPRTSAVPSWADRLHGIEPTSASSQGRRVPRTSNKAALLMHGRGTDSRVRRSLLIINELVEAAGVEPASGNVLPEASTRLADSLISSRRPRIGRSPAGPARESRHRYPGATGGHPAIGARPVPSGRRERRTGYAFLRSQCNVIVGT